MGFKNLKEYMSPRGRSYMPEREYDIAMSMHEGTSKTRRKIAFYLSNKFLKEQRWMIGDRVSVLYDKDENLCQLRRLNGASNSSDGWKISGKGRAGKITFDWKKGMPNFVGTHTVDPISENGVILVECPKIEA